MARLLAAASLSALAVGSPAATSRQDSAIRQSTPAHTGAISGSVRSAASSLPIPRARVILTSETLTAPRVAITAKDGAFSFEHLSAGAYTLHASGSGYAPRFYQQRGNAQRPSMSIAAGERATGINIELPPAGVIVGRVLDEDGRPFVGATVDALVRRMENNQATLVSLTSTVTDDRGEFRLTPLAAGRYYVSAFDPAFAEVGDESGPLRYTPTYYPGVVLIEQAQRVTVSPGAETMVTVVFPLKIVRPARVSGKIVTSDGAQLLSGALIMTPVGGGAPGPAASDVRMHPDGTFTFRNVAPGRYQIRARADTGADSVTRVATYMLVVNGHDIDNVTMSLLPGALVEGRVIVEAQRGSKRPSFSKIRVRAPFADGSSFGDAAGSTVGEDGGFRIGGLMPGPHAISIEGLEYPWTVKDVLWRGQDVTGVAMNLAAGQRLDNLRVTITDVATEVTGVVRGGTGQPIEGAVVLIIPVAPQFWNRASHRFAMVRTGPGGRYRVRGLPPGEYRAVASAELDEAEAYGRELLQKFVEIGDPLALDEPGPYVLDLALTSVPRGTGSSKD